MWTAWFHLIGPPDNIGRAFVVSFMETAYYDYTHDIPLELYITTTEKHTVRLKGNITKMDTTCGIRIYFRLTWTSCKDYY